MATEVKSESGITINAQTKQNRMHETGYHEYVARQKPLIKRSSR